VGYAPVLAPIEQLPGLGTAAADTAALFAAEVGLFWAIDPEHRGRGYATEAGRALIEHAFTHLHLKRIVTTTEFDNTASGDGQARHAPPTESAAHATVVPDRGHDG